MVRLLADENFNGDVVRGLLRRKPDCDIVRVQDVGLSGADDEVVLEWAAVENRVLLTHDAKTMPRHSNHRLVAGKNLPGVFIISNALGIGPVIEDLLLIVECSNEDEWRSQVTYFPLS